MLCHILAAPQVGAGFEVFWVFIDAEKAFDNLNWEFLFLVLDKLELGRNFQSMVLAIYQDQLAAIRISNDVTKLFKVEKGTRQGCPLSPLLFILCIEFLLIKIREVEGIQGLKHQKWEYRTRAYADDLFSFWKTR